MLLVVTHRTTLALALLCMVAPGCARFAKRSTVAELERARQLTFAGMTHGQKEQWTEAEGYYRQAVEACPQDERAHALLAEALWQKGDFKAAIEQQQQTVVRSGGGPQQHTRLGEMLLSMGKTDDALAQADLALEKDRQLVSSWNLKGSVLVSQNRIDDALSCYHRSLSIDEGQIEVHENVAFIYERMGRPQRALATWYAVEELYPPDQIPSSVLYREAMAMRRLNRGRKAMDLLQVAYAQTPDAPEVIVALAELQYEFGDPVNAQMTLAQGQKQFPSHPEVIRLSRSWANATDRETQLIR